MIPTIIIAALAMIGPAGAASSDSVVSGAAAVPLQAAPPPAALIGYRNARFGMNESQVRGAIKKDLASAEIRLEQNELEHTTVLVVAGQQLLEESPLATVSYILGAKSAKLFQVNIVWGDNGGADVKKIFATAHALSAYFVEQWTYAKDSVVMNQGLPDGSLLVFRGTDTSGRMVALHFLPILEPADPKAPPQVKKATLKLSYIENPAKPDIFRIEKGKF